MESVYVYVQGRVMPIMLIKRVDIKI